MPPSQTHFPELTASLFPAREVKKLTVHGLDRRERSAGSHLPKGVIDKRKDFEVARKKLYNYWRQLGCKEIAKSGYLAIDNTEKLPSIEELLKRNSVRRKR